MEIFISFRFTGEDFGTLQQTMSEISQALIQAGHEPYCSINDEDFFLKNNFTTRQILNHALTKLEQSDVVLAFVNSDNRSEGMLIELGYALAKRKKIILAAKKGASIHTSRSIADRVIEFENLEHLRLLLNEYKFT